MILADNIKCISEMLTVIVHFLFIFTNKGDPVDMNIDDNQFEILQNWPKDSQAHLFV